MREAGVARIVVNAHAHAGQLRAHLARVAPEALVSHEPLLLETGGGLQAALPLLGPGPVFTLNADMVWRGPNPLRRSPPPGVGRTGRCSAWCRGPARVGHGGPGDFFVDAGGRLRRRGAAEAADFVYTGAQIIDPAALAGFPDAAFSLNGAWDALLAEGRLRGIVHPGGWVDVGRPEGIALAEAELAR